MNIYKCSMLCFCGLFESITGLFIIFFVREELFDEVNDGLNPFSIKLRQYNSQNNIDFCATLL